MSAGLVNSIVAVVVLAFLAWMLYRPKVQESITYKALVIPLANIMDVGFIVLSPVIILLVGYDAPWVMLGICLLAIATGFAISYNVRNYEPLEGKPDRLHGWNSFALWALIAASVVNIAYYAQLLMSLVLLPLGDLYTPGLATATAAIVLGIVAFIGFFWGLSALNRLGNRTTAFNLAAIVAVLAAFAVYNLQQLIGADFEFPDFDAPNDAETFRKVIGLFAIVQGFEASRYLGAYFSADLRIRTMRIAQVIASAVFVLFVGAVLIAFTKVRPPEDVTAIFIVSGEVSVFLPFLIMAAALGSQLSAIVNATESRTDMLTQRLKDRLPHRWTFPLLLVPAILVVLLTDVTSAVALASRVFAFYFLLQAFIAGRLAWRARQWGWVLFFTGVGLAMATISIFGIPA